MMYRYIPWNTGLVCNLLNIIIIEGAHIAKKSEITKKWNAVNEGFFNQNEALPWKAELYKKDDFRKLRDKFKQVMASTKADIDTGNQSGKSGDLEPQYELVKQIMIDIEENEEEEIEKKKKEDDTKKALNDIEGKAQGNRPNPLKKRDLDGNITDNSDPSKKIKRDSFDEKLLRWMDDRSTSKTSASASSVVNESFTKGKLLNFVADTNTSLEMMLNQAEITDADEDQVGQLYRIGMKVLIDIYCTRGWNFSSTAFRNEMKEMGLEPVIAHKLFVLLEEWRLRLDSSRANKSTPDSSDVTLIFT